MIWNHDSLVRARRVIGELIDSLALDLRGKSVITEAATGPFAVTASIAAMAGASVQAIAATSPHGTAEQAAEATLSVANACGVDTSLTIVSREMALYDRADIVTNLGPIRPLDHNLLGRLRSGAVIPLMYDARETRRGEIDLAFCERQNVTVVGTNEDHPMVDVLRYSGHLVAKMLMEQQIEILRSRIAVIGDNLFTPHILNETVRLGAHVIPCRSWDELAQEPGNSLDAVIYIDYWNRTGSPENSNIGQWLLKNSGTLLIQFVGGLDTTLFKGAGWPTVPDHPIAPQRMWRTLADLGIRPVIELHAAGLKAAEMELNGIPHYSGGRLRGLRQSLTPSAASSPRLVPTA
jgi:hypothetical protein